MKFIAITIFSMIGIQLFAYQCSNVCYQNPNNFIQNHSLAIFNDKMNCKFESIANLECQYLYCTMSVATNVQNVHGQTFALDQETCFSCRFVMAWATAYNPDTGGSAYMWGNGGYSAVALFGTNYDSCKKCRNKTFSCQIGGVVTVCPPDGDGGGTGCPPEFPDCKRRFKFGDPCPNTPLVIDLGKDGFNLGREGRYVPFDMRGSGKPVYLQWFSRNGNDALLFQDLNQNGLADDGTELFGSGNKLTASDEWAPNGFVALAQYDRVANGGNDDGYITQDDRLWQRLKLWIDLDADGRCVATEVFPLAKFGILALDTIPEAREVVDLANNMLPLWSNAVYDLETGDGYDMVDVFFRIRTEKTTPVLQVRDQETRNREQ